MLLKYKFSMALLALALAPLIDAAQSHSNRWNRESSVLNDRYLARDDASNYYHDDPLSSMLYLQNLGNDLLGQEEGDYGIYTKVYARSPESDLEHAIKRRNDHDNHLVHKVDLKYHKAKGFGDDDTWTGLVQIGTKPFNLQFKTESSDVWVVSANAREVVGNKYYAMKDTWNGQYHKTPKEPFKPQHGVDRLLVPNDERVNSKRIDVVTVADIQVTHYTFGTVVNPTIYFMRLPIEGVFGLGFRTLSAPGFSPFLDEVLEKKTKSLKEKWLSNQPFEPGIFAFYLAKQNSQLRIGGTGNPDVFVPGSIEYHKLIPLDRDGAGQPVFSYFAIGGGQVSMTYTDDHGFREAEIATSVQATIESGTNMILAPPEYVSKIYAKISGSGYVSSGHYGIPCEIHNYLFPGIRFSWHGGKEWMLRSESFIMSPDPKNPTLCIGAIQVKPATKGHPHIWVLGSSFMMNVFSVFDKVNLRVGFGVLTHLAHRPSSPSNLLFG